MQRFRAAHVNGDEETPMDKEKTSFHGRPWRVEPDTIEIALKRDRIRYELQLFVPVDERIRGRNPRHV